MVQQYYIRDDRGRIGGPYSGNALRRFAREGKLLPSWHISIDKKKWTAAARVQNLFPELEQALSADLPASGQYRNLTRKEQVALFVDRFVLNNDKFKDSLPFLQSIR